MSGPAAADPALFVDRAWAVCAVAGSAPAAVGAVVDLAGECRARPVFLEPAEHDRVLARLSHAPQLVASALAAALVDLEPDTAALAGTGLRDTTRVADSDPQMWGQIAQANADALAEALRAVAGPLVALADLLAERPAAGGASASELVSRGRRGRALLPGKHGRQAASYATVHCVVPDEPGALARLLADAAAEGVNVEDLRVEHAPGQPVGVVELAVTPQDRPRLLDGLRTRGWTATPGGDEAL
jgi:prephenate dehydrogenase